MDTNDDKPLQDFSYTEEDCLLLTKLTKAQGIDIPYWLEDKLGHGDRLLILDGLVGAGKTSLAKAIEASNKHTIFSLFGAELFDSKLNLKVIDEPLEEFAEPLKKAMENPNRQTLTRLQARVIKAWESKNPEILTWVSRGNRVLIIRGPQGYYLFDNGLIPSWARKVFIHRITQMVHRWLVAQGLPEGLCPSRVYIDVPGETLEEKIAVLSRVLAKRQQVGDDGYSWQTLMQLVQTVESANRGESLLAQQLYVAPGISLRWHTAFYEIMNWVEAPIVSSPWITLTAKDTLLAKLLIE